MPSIDDNRRHWSEEHDWSERGEDWTRPDPRWKQTIVDHAIAPYVSPATAVLEVGPGGGRWTAEILRFRPRRLIVADLVERCLEICRERFAGRAEVEYRLGDGRTLSFLGAGEVDLVWSFDVFVHIERPELESYFREFRRVLRGGGTGVIHYATIDRARTADARVGWRADYRSADMFELLRRLGLELVHDHYHPELSSGNTSVVVFRKPPDPSGSSAR